MRHTIGSAVMLLTLLALAIIWSDDGDERTSASLSQVRPVPTVTVEGEGGTASAISTLPRPPHPDPTVVASALPTVTAIQESAPELKQPTAASLLQAWPRVAACIRSYESDTAGGYRAVSPSGKYRGAYQMDNDFWLAYGGDPALTGIHERASVEEQDAVAYRGWLARGLAPWPNVHC